MRAAVCAFAFAGLIGLGACASNDDEMAAADTGVYANTAAEAPPAPAPEPEPAPAPEPTPAPPPADTGAASDTSAQTGERG